MRPPQNTVSKPRLVVSGDNVLSVKLELSITSYPPFGQKIQSFLAFRVYYERPMVIDSLNLKLRQITRFLSNVILDEMSFAECHLLFGFCFDCSV